MVRKTSELTHHLDLRRKLSGDAIGTVLATLQAESDRKRSFCQNGEFDTVIRLASPPIDWLIPPTLVRTDDRGRESRCQPLKVQDHVLGGRHRGGRLSEP